MKWPNDRIASGTTASPGLDGKAGESGPDCPPSRFFKELSVVVPVTPEIEKVLHLPCNVEIVVPRSGRHRSESKVGDGRAGNIELRGFPMRRVMIRFSLLSLPLYRHSHVSSRPLKNLFAALFGTTCADNQWLESLHWPVASAAVPLPANVSVVVTEPALRLQMNWRLSA